jgi:biotin carboxyl carrier protein
MRTNTFACIALVTVIATPAFAHGNSYQQPAPSLVSAAASVGARGSLANVTANVARPNSLANVNASLLGGAVKANVDVGQTSRQGTTLLGIGLGLDGGVGNRH